MTWTTTPLKHAARVGYGLGQPPALSDTGVPILRATNITRGRFTRDGLIYAAMADLPLDRAPLLREGEILVVRSGAYTGDSAMVTGDWVGSAPGYDLRVSPLDAHPGYIAYCLLSKAVLDQVDLAKARAAQPHLNAEDLGDVRISIPPIDKQRRIADFLDAETARINALVDQKRRVVALIDERVQGLVNKITPGAMVSGVDGRPIGITGMQCVRLGAIAEVHGGFTMDAGRDTAGDSVTLPYLRVANVQDGALALDDVKEVTLPRALARRCTLRPGDVLMTEGGDPDKLGRGTVWPGGIEPCLHQNAIFAVRPNPQLLPEYLALVTRTRYARAYFEMTASKATGIAHTSSTKITSFRVPMLTTAEQNQVILDIQEALARIDALRAPAERQLTLLAERKQALITAAVTGGITV